MKIFKPRLQIMNIICMIMVLFWVSEPTCALKHQNRKKLAREREERNHEKEINLCDIEQELAPLFCYCNDNRISSAEEVNCLIFNQLNLIDPIWGHFNSQMYIKKLGFTVKSDGSLDYVPTGVLQMLKNLYVVNFQYAKLESIETQAFAQIYSISELYLSKNSISVLKWHAFEGLRNLTVLNLDDNSIAEISKDIFYDVPKLQKLFLNNNNITIIHDRAFKHLPQLQELHLNNNKIADLNVDSFQGLDLMLRLDLSNNQITKLGDYVFSPMPDLQVLNLEQNKINQISGKTFDGLRKLKTLRLSENKIYNFKDNFLMSTPALSFLDLRNNAFRTVELESIKPILSNFYDGSSHLLLDGNKLMCDCKLTWIWSLRNDTQNPSLKESLQELKCLLEAQYEPKFDQSMDTIDRALEIVRGGGDYVEETSTDYDYEFAMKVGSQVVIDGKTTYVKNLFSLRPDILPCPSETQDEPLASGKPYDPPGLGSSSSFFSFVNSANSFNTQKFAIFGLIAVSVFASSA